MLPILRGFSQIGFQNNSVSGLLILCAIAVNSWLMLLMAILAVVIAYYIAYHIGQKLGAEPSDLEAGLYGYNAALLGIALVNSVPLSAWLLFLLPLGATFTVGLMLVFRKILRLPAYSCPFILSAWILLWLALLLAGESVSELHSGEVVYEELNLLNAVLNGVGQVSFQPSPMSGVLVLLALAVGSLPKAGWALLASVCSVIFAYVLGLDSTLINTGFFSFNAILAVLVVVDRMQCQFWSLLAIVLLMAGVTVLLSAGLMKLGLIAFTTPFVLSTYLLGSITRWRLG
ncbi:urea transporter [Oceanospirillum beijerinckii]|uniref:urea transporter n=1 Tax=Oceanospirillum beijerinckii TaxID=64976 RepID=UPI0003F89A0E|nr:urea transporter [Oceanospirillum beijerinckii]